MLRVNIFFFWLILLQLVACELSAGVPRIVQARYLRSSPVVIAPLRGQSPFMFEGHPTEDTHRVRHLAARLTCRRADAGLTQYY